MLLFFSLVSYKVTNANIKGLKSSLSKTDYSVVLFYSNKFSSAKRLLNMMNVISNKFEGKVNIITADIDVMPDLKSQYGVNKVSKIGIFYKSDFRMFFTGEYTAPVIIDFIESLYKTQLRYINDSFDLFEFQELRPANLVITQSEFEEKGHQLALSFSNLMHIGIVCDSNLVRELNLAPFTVTRPMDFFQKELTTYDVSKFQLFATSPYERIAFQDHLTASSKEKTLCILLDEENPLHVYKMSTIFRESEKILASNYGFQYCDFFNCPQFVRQIGIARFTNPIYFIHGRVRMSNGFDIYQQPLQSPKHVIDWIKFIALGISPPKSPNSLDIPRLYADEFIPVALNPKLDVALFVATPGQKDYKLARQNVIHLIQIFDGIDTVRFYEFDPQTEHVQGLQIPKSDNPQLSIWPASEIPSGSVFAANYPLEVIVENFLKVVKSKIHQSTLKVIGERLKAIQSS